MAKKKIAPKNIVSKLNIYNCLFYFDLILLLMSIFLGIWGGLIFVDTEKYLTTKCPIKYSFIFTFGSFFCLGVICLLAIGFKCSNLIFCCVPMCNITCCGLHFVDLLIKLVFFICSTCITAVLFINVLSNSPCLLLPEFSYLRTYLYVLAFISVLFVCLICVVMPLCAAILLCLFCCNTRCFYQLADPISFLEGGPSEYDPFSTESKEFPSSTSINNAKKSKHSNASSTNFFALSGWWEKIQELKKSNSCVLYFINLMLFKVVAFFFFIFLFWFKAPNWIMVCLYGSSFSSVLEPDENFDFQYKKEENQKQNSNAAMFGKRVAEDKKRLLDSDDDSDGTPTEQTIMRDAMDDVEQDEEEEDQTSSSVKPPMIDSESDTLPNSLTKNSLNTNTNSLNYSTSSSIPRENQVVGQDSQNPNQYLVVSQDTTPEETKTSPYGT